MVSVVLTRSASAMSVCVRERKCVCVSERERVCVRSGSLLERCHSDGLHSVHGCNR
ncbi:MAG TPA: hypothetical protein V6C97_05870 [Oculatellaceae cyanobacterium]